MKKPVVLIVALVAVAGIAVIAWLLFGGSGDPGSTLGAEGDPARRGAPAGGVGPGGVAPGQPAGAGGRERGAAAEARKLPPPPASGESTVVGHVFDFATRAPIAHASVVLRHPQGEYAVSGESQADGAFVLERVPGVVGARLFVSAAGYGPRVLRDVHVPPHDRLDLGPIDLERGTPIRGRVVAALGAPISGAQVDLLEARKPANASGDDLLQIFRNLRKDDETLDEVATAADGTFTFPAAAPGSYVLAARKPGWQLRFSTPVTVMAGAAPPNVELRLGEAKPFKGIVKDEAGAPIAGASVAGLEILQEDPGFMPKSQKTVTGADGKFSYTSFGSGSIAVIVEAVGYSGVTKSLLSAGSKEVEIVLKKAARLEGRVYDRGTGKGLEGAVVVAVKLAEEFALEETRTGPEGKYAIEHAPSGGQVTIYAKHPGYTMASLLDLKLENKHPFNEMGKEDLGAGITTRRDVAMVAGGSVSGTVVDDATGNGIAGAIVTARQQAGLEFLGVCDPLKATTGADGSFTIAPLGAGETTLTALAANYISAEEATKPEPSQDGEFSPDDLARLMAGPGAHVEIAPGGSVTGQILHMRRGVEIDVVVKNPDGVAMAGATVSWMMQDEGFGGPFGQEKPVRSVVCDAVGKARVCGLPRRKDLVIAARHPDFPTGGHVKIDTSSPPDHPVVVVLRAGASFAGVLLDPDGKPEADRPLALLSHDDDAGRAFGDWTWAGRTAVTDASGRFLFENVPPGPATVDLSDRPGQEADEAHDDCLDPSQKSVTLVAGKREQVTLQLVRRLAISGRVLDAAGKPVEGANVSGTRVGEAEMGTTQTSADGSFLLNGLVPGDYEVQVEGPQTSSEVPPETARRTIRAGATGVELRLTK